MHGSRKCSKTKLGLGWPEAHLKWLKAVINDISRENHEGLHVSVKRRKNHLISLRKQ